MNTFHTRYWNGLSALLLLGLLTLFPAQSAQGITQGLLCCSQRVIPALFPFFVVSDLLMSTSAAGWLGLLARPYTRSCLGIQDEQAPAALMLSWLGGFAVAAKTISELYEKGHVSKHQAELLLVCAVGSSPAFVINTVGLLMLHSIRLGICLFLSLFFSSLICGILCSKIFSSTRQDAFCSAPGSSTAYSAGLVPAVGRAVHTTLTVCGFVLFFSCISNCLKAILAHFDLTSSFVSFFLDTMLEVTGGCLSGSKLPSAWAPFACCTALSVLSLSVCLQVRALSGQSLSLKLLLWSRSLHLALSLVFLRIFLKLVPGSLDAVSTLAAQVIPQNRLAPDAAFILFLLCCLILHFTSGNQWTIMFEGKKSNRFSRKAR